MFSLQSILTTADLAILLFYLFYASRTYLYTHHSLNCPQNRITKAVYVLYSFSFLLEFRNDLLEFRNSGMEMRGLEMRARQSSQRLFNSS